MRRAAALLFGTLAGTGLLVGAKVGNASIDGPVAAAATGTSGVVVAGPGVTGPGATTTGGSPAPAKTATSGKPATAPSPGAASPDAGPTTSKPTTKPTTKPTPTTTPTATGPKDGRYQASSSEHYGTLTLTVTISGHKITDIAASYASNSPSYCTQKACPKLRSEALAAQSARISAVSGATYTSDAYIAALGAVLKSAA